MTRDSARLYLAWEFPVDTVEWKETQVPGQE